MPLFVSLRTDWLRCVEPLPTSDLELPDGEAASFQHKWTTVFALIKGPCNGLVQVPVEQEQEQGQEPEVFGVGAPIGQSAAPTFPQYLWAQPQQEAQIVVSQYAVGSPGGKVQQAPLEYFFPDKPASLREVCGFLAGTSVLAEQPITDPFAFAMPHHLPRHSGHSRDALDFFVGWG